MLYRRLQQHLDRMPVGFPPTESGVELRILERIFTPEEAALTLELSAIPEPASTIRKRLHPRPELAELTPRLDAMADRGLILRMEAEGRVLYGKLIFAIGFYERQVKRLTPELESDCRQYMEEAFGAAFHSRKTTQLRVVPVNRAIPIERNVATYEDMRAYAQANDGPFAAMTCICRHGQDLRGEPCRQTQLRENCLMLGMAAKEMVRTGVAQPLSKPEWLERLDAAEREGLVLQPENTKSPLFVCCCCGCCCGVLTSAKRFPRPAEYFSASWRAEVRAELCHVCGLCVQRCQMEALAEHEGAMHVNGERCIGCGLCVTTCEAGALQLVARESGRTPPDDTRALYVQLLRERFGLAGLVGMAGRHALGIKV